jgi:hypothetical protein
VYKIKEYATVKNGIKKMIGRMINLKEITLWSNIISASRLIEGGALILAERARNHHSAIEGEMNNIPLLIIRFREPVFS